VAAPDATGAAAGTAARDPALARQGAQERASARACEGDSRLDRDKMGGRKSLGGARALDSLRENDDARERQERRRTLARQSVPGAGAGGESDGESDGESEAGALQVAVGVVAALASGKKGKRVGGGGGLGAVSYDLSSVLSMCSSNKLTASNSWSVDLLDRIDDVLDAQTGSFQKASVTLQASVSIYEKRVDSTHQDTFKMLENVNRTRIGAAGDAEESRAKRKAGGATKQWGTSSHLESNLTNITHLRVEREYEVDPLFRKMSKTFDAGGAKGLLLHHLVVHQGPCVVFDTSETRAFPPAGPDPAAEEDEEERPVSWLGDVAPSNAAPACPSLEVVHRMLDASGSRSADEAEAAQLRHEAEAEAEAPLPEELPAALHELGAEHGADLYYEDEGHGFVFDAPAPDDEFFHGADEASPEREHVTVTASSAHHVLRPLQLPDNLDFTLRSAYSFFKPAAVANSRDAHWAGASHWRLGAKARAAAAPAKAPRGKKQPATLDLLGARPAIDFPARPASINLSQGAAAAAAAKHDLDLPEDLHYSVRDLCTLFLRPVVISEVLSRGGDAGARRGSGGASSAPNNDSDHAAGYFDSYDDDAAATAHGLELAPEHRDAVDMVAPSHVLSNINIDYARRAKIVDVKKLKGTLWQQVEESLDEHHQREDRQHSEGRDHDDAAPHVSFVESVRATAPKVDDPNVTVPFYFICLLHLANENNLELLGRKDLADFTIR
jgi:condensin complex subunit 2